MFPEGNHELGTFFIVVITNYTTPDNLETSMLAKVYWLEGQVRIGVLELSKVVKARYEKGALRLLEPVQLEEGEEVLVRIESLDDRKKIVEKFYGKRGSTPKKLLDEFMLEKEVQ